MLNPNDRRIVITGIGTINAIGTTVEEYWENLIQGKNGVRLIQKTDMEDYHVQIAAEADLPDLTEYFPKKRITKRLDEYILFGHIAGCQAIRDSGLDIEKSPERYGTIMGTGDGGITTHFRNIETIVTQGMAFASPFYVISAIPNTGSAYLAQEWNLRGPSFSVNSACATSNHAMGTAAMLIKMGMADAMITGGSEAPINKSAIPGFGNIMALSSRNDDPATASRPFDKDRDGFVMGEGAGMFCLEELEHAKKRGAKIYAELTGFGFSSDAYDLVAPHPEARGEIQALKAALDMAQLNPEDVGLVNAHATSTPMGDKVEGVALNSALGDWGKKVPVHSTKSMVGHLLGGAGAVEAIASFLAFEKDIVHPTVNVFNQDPEIDLNVIKETTEIKNIDHIVSDSFGFGGHNACMVFSRFKG